MVIDKLTAQPENNKYYTQIKYHIDSKLYTVATVSLNDNLCNHFLLENNNNNAFHPQKQLEYNLIIMTPVAIIRLQLIVLI